MTKGDKSKITRYHSRIGKALERGYKPTKTRNDGRIVLAHKAQGIRGMPALKMVFVKPTGAGFRASIGKDGSIRSVNSKSGISKISIGAKFFDENDVIEGIIDESEVEIEADRLRKAAKKALGHKPQRCSVAFWGGENAWVDPSLLDGLLVVQFNRYEKTGGFPADAVAFYWVKQTKNVLKVQQKLRDDRTLAAQKRAQKRKNSDI